MRENHTINSVLVFCLLISFTMVSCGQDQETSAMLINDKFDRKLHQILKLDVPIISVDSVYAHRKDYLLLDARSEEEYEVSRIPGAVYVGYKDFSLDALPEFPQMKQVVVYCSVGARSEEIARKITEATGEKTLNLYGSIFAWVNHGYLIVDPENQETEKIHTYNKKWSKWVINDKMEKVW